MAVELQRASVSQLTGLILAKSAHAPLARIRPIRADPLPRTQAL